LCSKTAEMFKYLKLHVKLVQKHGDPLQGLDFSYCKPQGSGERESAGPYLDRSLKTVNKLSPGSSNPRSVSGEASIRRQQEFPAEP